MENARGYLAGANLSDMLANGNTRKRQQALDIIKFRLNEKVAEDVESGKLQLRDRVLFDTVIIHNGTNAFQIAEFFATGVKGEVKGYNNVATGKIDKPCIMHGLMLEYGQKPVATSAEAFIKTAFPLHILTGVLEMEYDSSKIMDTGLQHFCRPSQDNNNLLNGLCLDLNNPKVFYENKVINAKINMLNAIPLIAGTVQMLKLSIDVTEFSANISQGQ